MITIEEKAKAYDEAIDVAKNRLKDCHGDCFLRKEIEKIFPVLAETEDERIRKALIDFFEKKVEKGFEWVEYGIPNNAVLAWLKKQKEPDFEKIESLKNSIDREYIIPKERVFI